MLQRIDTGWRYIRQTIFIFTSPIRNYEMLFGNTDVLRYTTVSLRIHLTLRMQQKYLIFTCIPVSSHCAMITETDLVVAK